MPTRQQSLKIEGTAMALDALLALGLVLSTTSQLRLAGGIGPGEICLALWVVVMVAREAVSFGPPLTPALSRLLVFWSIFAAAQCIGTLAGFAIGDRHDSSLFLHDALAYPFLGALSVLTVVEPGARARLERTAWLVAILGAATLALQLANAAGLIHFLGTDPWYWDRMRGWSENPNELALFCAAHALLSLYLGGVDAGDRGQKLALACGALSVIAGRLSKSDTFSLVLVSAIPVFLAFKFRAWLLSFGPLLTLRSATAWIAFVGFPIFLLSAAPLGYSLATQTEGIVSERADASPRIHEQRQDRMFHMEIDSLMNAVILQRTDHLKTGAIPNVRQPGITMPAEIALQNAPVFRAIEHRTPRFELAHAIRSFLGVQFRHAPIVQILAAAHRVGEMNAPVIAIVDVAHRRGHAAFGHHCMRFAEQ